MFRRAEKQKGLYILSRCGLQIPKGFVAVDVDNDLSIQMAADHYENGGFKRVAVRSSATAEDNADFSRRGAIQHAFECGGERRREKGVKKAVWTR